MSWEVKSLDNIIIFQRGFDLPKTDFKVGDFPVVGSTGIIGFHNEFKVKSPCVVTGRSGTLGVFQYLNEDFWAHNTTLWVKEFQGNHPKFIYYLLQTLDFKSLNGGVAVPTLNRNVLKNVFISYPKSLETQKRIASILSNYDDLIENNLKRIKLLEETVQNIYKEWFVNFRFPNYEHTEFDAQSVLPVGWEITELENLVTLRQGFALNKKSGHHISNEVTEYPLLKISDLFNDTETLFVKNSIPKQFLVDEEEIIFSRTGQVGHAFMGRKGVIYNNCFRVIANANINTYFLFSTMLFPSFVSYAKGLATGVAQPDLNHGAFKSIKITNPSIELQNEFSLIFKKNLQLKYCLKNQNKKLKEARDILLPRLMNRTIEV